MRTKTVWKRAARKSREMRVLKGSAWDWVICERKSQAGELRHTLPPVIGPRRCAWVFSAALPFATSITETHLGRLRRRSECQTHHLPSFRNKWQAQTWWEPISFHCQLRCGSDGSTQPPLPFSLKSMWGTPASHARVCFRESGFGLWSAALYSGEQAGGTAWGSQLPPHWLQQPTSSWRTPGGSHCTAFKAPVYFISALLMRNFQLYQPEGIMGCLFPFIYISHRKDLSTLMHVKSTTKRAIKQLPKGRDYGKSPKVNG